MPGTLVFKPIQAKLDNKNDFFRKLDSYCIVQLGQQEVKGRVSKNGGQNPFWDDTLVVKRIYEPHCIVKIMEKAWTSADSIFGITEINLREIEDAKHLTKWYPIMKDNQPVGEILLETIFSSDVSGVLKQTTSQQSYAQPPSYGANDYLYSPARQWIMDHDRQIKQMQPLIQPQPSGLSYTPDVSHAHVSHHLTPEEYQKLHSRQHERYTPKNPVFKAVETPPSWPGYESNQNKTQNIEKHESMPMKAPDNLRKTLAGLEEKSTTSGLVYIPTLGGLKYVPGPKGSGYRPVEGNERAKLNSNQTEKAPSGNVSTIGSLSALDESCPIVNSQNTIFSTTFETSGTNTTSNLAV